MYHTHLRIRCAQSVGRTSALTRTLIRVLTTTLLVGSLPGVSADCYDEY